MSELLWPEDTDRIVLDEVDSTMAEAARRASDLFRPTWIMAHHQTAARGRRGKSWENPAGNLSATYVFKPEVAPAAAALRSFSAANALFEALALYVDRTRLSNKWPNDVLLDGGKVAGVLLESAGSPEGVDWLSIGIGVNLASPPLNVRDAAFPPICLKEATGQSVTPEELLSLLAVNMATEEKLMAELGFAPIRERWLRHAARLGEVITARTHRGDVTGRFETIDTDGQLVLHGPTGQVTIPAGDVFF